MPVKRSQRSPERPTSTGVLAYQGVLSGAVDGRWCGQRGQSGAYAGRATAAPAGRVA